MTCSEVERVQRHVPDVAEADGYDVAATPEHLLQPAHLPRHDHVSERQLQPRQPVDAGHLGLPGDPNKRRAARAAGHGLRPGKRHEASLAEQSDTRARPHPRPVTRRERQETVLLDREAERLDLPSQRRVGRVAVDSTGHLTRPEEIEVLRDLGGRAICRWGYAPRHCHRHGAHPFRDVFAPHASRHEERSNREFRASVRRDKYLGVRRHDRGSEHEKYESEADDQPSHLLRAA